MNPKAQPATAAFAPRLRGALAAAFAGLGLGLACAVLAAESADSPAGGVAPSATRDKPADGSGAGSPAADTPKPVVAPREHLHRRPAGAGFEDKVKLLTKGLDLDPVQQTRLRAILESERRQIRALWMDSTNPAGDRVAPTLAILDRSREQIRGMLNEEQKAKYGAALPRNEVAPAHADVDFWMRLTQPPAPDASGPAN